MALPLIAAIALVASVLSTLPLARLALRFGQVDRPGPRSEHREPVPLAGGAAILLGLCVAAVVDTETADWLARRPILAGGLALFAVGTLDDRRPLPASVKLVMQVLAAMLALGSGAFVQWPVPGVANALLTVVWIVGITNAVNLLDNADGLAGGITLVAGTAFACFATASGPPGLAGAAAATAGVATGFLVHNLRGRTFLGDAGSLPVGYFLAVLGLECRFPGVELGISWAIPVLVLAVPVLDTCLVTFSRLRRGRNPLTTPGRDHASHRLRRAGWSRRSVLGLHWSTAVLGAGLATAVAHASFPSGLGIVAGAAAAGLLALAALERLPSSDVPSGSSGAPTPSLVVDGQRPLDHS